MSDVPGDSSPAPSALSTTPAGPDHFLEMTELLRAAWEGQPFVSLPQVWAQLAGLGVGSLSSDAELSLALTHLSELHPCSATAAGADATVLVETCEPVRRVTFTADGMLIARSGQMQPVVWPVGRVLSSRPGGELAVEDRSGFVHSLGRVVRMTVLEKQWELFGDTAGDTAGGTAGGTSSAVDLSGCSRSALGGAVFVGVLDSGDVVVCDRAIQVVTAQRRSASVEVLRGWQRVVAGRCGEPVVVRLAGGEDRQVGAGVLTAMWRVE
ncbi:hypothetical protein F7230_07505 [Corynebacterium sp. 320]|uniref:hypothetical protein n=1 Tax=Corynebacterium TaxID=1716 RepID=UPI00125CB1B5|nr:MULTISPECIES: hypothetical protein [Corynebacterium]KAB1502836.1 hypothetical protein F7230_07505 [Corynebacterium sp. 320]KAB1552347.1 hypothetical protein F7233_00825 [Corynebacterium sp. 321]KAB1554438.1 hypothetical protein F7232_05770 [Corynebacterium sp. 319]KAB3526499.1 hypothetical protein F8354_07505 [Corynebacterium sp. 250]KAB3539819.1 hypothetical protein F8390_00560 [Corynebacterium sp. 366]